MLDVLVLPLLLTVQRLDLGAIALSYGKKFLQLFFLYVFYATKAPLFLSDS